MTNIDELVEIIKDYGGAASIDEIIKGYQKKHPMVILAEHKAIMLNTLQSNPSTVSFNQEQKKWVTTAHNVSHNAPSGQHASELSQTVTPQLFEKAYRAFIEQADKNAISKKAQGTKAPSGFSERPFCDGAHFKPQYGQGAASVAPYMNWWVVSIYYLPENGNIIMGIEEDRYPHISEISVKPLRYAQVGKKTIQTVVYYSANKNSVNYGEMYETFISVCEEVMRLGLE